MCAAAVALTDLHVVASQATQAAMAAKHEVRF